MRVENHSGYPRVGDAPDLQELRQALEAAARGDAPEADLLEAQQETTRLSIREQESAGCDMVTDAQVRWHDGISHFAGNFENVVHGSLLRFFGTPFPVLQPLVRGKIRWKGPLTAPDIAFAVRQTKKPVKAILTGPVTLARHSHLETDAYRDLPDLAADYAEGLAAEAREIFSAGATAIQVEEPSISANPEDLPVLKAFLSRLSREKPAGATVTLATYLGDAEPVYWKLLELPIGGLTWDLSCSTTLAERITQGFSKILGLGVVDARSAVLEKPEDVARRVERIVAKARGEVRLLPSCSLEYLPREHARQKLEVLARAKRFLGG